MTFISTISRDLSDRCLCYQAMTFKSSTCVLDVFDTHTGPQTTFVVLIIIYCILKNTF